MVDNTLAAESPSPAKSPRERLLDAAEKLFAEFGFDAPSVRDITAAAGVRLAAVNEIFVGSEALTRAVIERFSTDLANDRLTALRKQEEEGCPALQGIVDAFVAPLFLRMQESEAWQNFAKISAQLVASASWDKKFGFLLETEAPAFIKAICRAEPRLDKIDAVWCYTFMMGTVATSTSRTGWVPQLSEGMVVEHDLGVLQDELITFVSEAIRSVADRVDALPPNFGDSKGLRASKTKRSDPGVQARSAKTRDLILNVAEKLFAANGFYGVSMRSIASAAGISFSLCHYHFKAKENVFLAMCLRRHPDLNDERWRLLEDARQLPVGRERLAAIVDAHLGTSARRLVHGGRGWRNFLQAMATAITSHGAYWLETMRVVSDDIAHAMVEEATQSIDGLSMRQAYFAHLFANGLMAVSYSGGGRVERLSGGAAKSTDYRDMYEHQLRFQVGGMLGMAQRSAG